MYQNCCQILVFILSTLLMSSCSTKNPVKKSFQLSKACLGCPEFIEQKSEDYLSAVSLKLEQPQGVYERAYLLRDLFFKAITFEDKGDFLRAEGFHKLLFKNQKNTFNLRKLSLTLLRNAKFQEANNLISNYLDFSQKLSPEELEIGVLLANIIESAPQNKNSAMVFYEKIIKQNRNSSQLCLKYADLLVQREKMSEAIDSLQLCEEKQESTSEKADIQFKLGRLYLDLNSLKESERYFTKSYNTYPESSKSLAALAVIFEETQRVPTYLKMFKNHLAKFPDDYLILSRLMDHHIDREDYVNAIVYLERMSDLNSQNSDLLFKLTYLYREVKRPSKAIETLDEIISQGTDSGKANYFISDLYTEVGKPSKAIVALQSVPPTSSFYADATMKLADQLRNKALEKGRSIASSSSVSAISRSRSYEAFINTKRKEKTNPKLDFELAVHKTLYFEKKKDFKSASASLASVEKSPLFDEKYTFYLASLYEKAKKFNQSDKVIENLLKDFPTHAEAHNFLGYSLLEREKISRAKVHIEKAYSLSPDDGHVLDSIGWLRVKEGKFKSAVKHLKAANEKILGDSTILFHLGVAYWNLGQKVISKGYLDEAYKRADEKMKETILKVFKKYFPNRQLAS